MRDPRNLNSVNCKEQEVTILKIDNLPDFDIQDYDLFDEKEFKKYIATIEKTIRSSFEYRAMVNYIREYMNMNKCSFYQNVNNIDTFKIKIHIHHEPFSLYDLTIAVYNKRCYYKESLIVSMVAKEVMYLHYKMMVGLIPLAETPHELVHNNYLFVPTDRVFGNFKAFLNMYGEFIPPETLEIYEQCLKYTEEYNSHRHLSNSNVLDKKLIYVDTTGVYDLPNLKEVINLMYDKIKEIKEKQNFDQSNYLINPITRVE